MENEEHTFVPGGYKLRVKRSRTGRGLFAEEHIPAGACVIEYTGRPATKEQMEDNTGKYLFWTSNTEMIDGNIPGNTARFINHSCDPNCESDGPDGRIFIMSLRDIQPGEELTFDYDTEYFETHIRPKGCRCNKCEPQTALEKVLH